MTKIWVDTNDKTQWKEQSIITTIHSVPERHLDISEETIPRLELSLLPPRIVLLRIVKEEAVELRRFDSAWCTMQYIYIRRERTMMASKRVCAGWHVLSLHPWTHNSWFKCNSLINILWIRTRRAILSFRKAQFCGISNLIRRYGLVVVIRTSNGDLALNRCCMYSGHCRNKQYTATWTLMKFLRPNGRSTVVAAVDAAAPMAAGLVWDYYW